MNLAYGLKPMATLKIEINGKEYEESSSGDGQYDAFVRALRKIYKVTLGRKFPMLTNYAVTIPPGGRTDAFVQTVITWSYDIPYTRIGRRPDGSGHQGDGEDAEYHRRRIRIIKNGSHGEKEIVF